MQSEPGVSILKNQSIFHAKLLHIPSLCVCVCVCVCVVIIGTNCLNNSGLHRVVRIFIVAHDKGTLSAPSHAGPVCFLDQWPVAASWTTANAQWHSRPNSEDKLWWRRDDPVSSFIPFILTELLKFNIARPLQCQ